MSIQKRFILISVFLALAFTTACSPGSQDSPAPSAQVAPPGTPSDDSNNTPEPPSDEDDSSSANRVSFDDVNDKVIVPRCVECHGASGGVNLEGYARVKNELLAIEEVALRYKMMPPPEKEPLTEEQLELLRKWIEQEKESR